MAAQTELAPHPLLAQFAFSERLLAWFETNGRHDLPWQHPRSPYFVWLAEIMLQQTQVATVQGYFKRFVERFPSLQSLAQAPLDEVLALWAGLGYYSRARNLHACARACVESFAGALPNNLDQLVALPGIGRSTAAAILSQAFNIPAAILDGNVKRVLCRIFGITGIPSERLVEKALWQLAEQLLPNSRAADYTQALMDFGATFCRVRKPLCAQCPFRTHCVALARGEPESLPTRKTKAKNAVRYQHWLIVRERSSGAILLQRRAELGIWGGLYSLPEAVDAADFLSQSLPLKRLSLETQLPEITHIFSHFTLKATPILARADECVGIAEGNWLWQMPEAMPALGLPAPVAKLLLGLIGSDKSANEKS